MHVLQDIDGVTVARGQATSDGVTLQLCAPSGFSEAQVYYPAESLTINTLAGLSALRQLCEELIEAHLELSQRGSV